MNFLITAGPTREYIDSVRFISNASSGKMGFALANAAMKSGHEVRLITSVRDPRLKTQNSGLKIIYVETTDEMFQAVKKNFNWCDCLIMAAAVADYTVARPAKNKIKKTNHPLTITLKPTPDILKWAGNKKIKYQKSNIKKKKIIVGFALEDRSLRANAEKKLKEKNLDMIIANSPSAIGSEKTGVQIKTPASRWKKLPEANKAAVAKKIISEIENL